MYTDISPRVESEGEAFLAPTIISEGLGVMNQLDSIEELYSMCSEKENTPRIVEVEKDDLDFVSDIEGPANPYMDS